MKYEKPSVVVLAAAEVIQSGQGKGGSLQDATNPQVFNSIGAYEADE